MMAKKRSSASAKIPVADSSDTPRDLASLEAEYDAAQAALENGDEWTGRDPAVIEEEMHAAELAARLASELNAGTDGNVTRAEFEEFKTAVAVAFLGIEAALREPNVSPRKVLNVVMANAVAIGFSKDQAKELADFERRASVVEKHYGNWDRSTKSQRERNARQAAYMRPRGI